MLKRIRPSWRWTGLLAFAALLAGANPGGVEASPSAGPKKMIDAPAADRLAARYGAIGTQRGLAIDAFLESLGHRGTHSQLAAVNEYFNSFEYRTDAAGWGVRDYWATPLEFIGRNGGDCEDFAIAKYFALRSLGVPDRNLSIAYVEMVPRGRGSHVVLLYRPPGSKDALVLDNARSAIVSLPARSDLLPRYAFNSRYVTLFGHRGDRAGFRTAVARLPAPAGTEAATPGTTPSRASNSTIGQLATLMQRMRTLQIF